MKHLRFDKYSSQNQSRQADKFCLILEICNAFIDNFQKCYVPNFKLIIDKQLFPCKPRCPFTQYMANKPDKFGIKFWFLANAKQSIFAKANSIW